MMAVEIIGRLPWGAMALISDGLHMSTHAGALVIAVLAYSCARRRARDERFVFGKSEGDDRVSDFHVGRVGSRPLCRRRISGA
jgi:Co/Zn/Cd efflux system component